MMTVPFLYPPGAEIREDLEMAYGEIQVISLKQEPYEVAVSAFCKRYHVIFGHALRCSYLCVPNLGISAFLSDSLFDLPRNRDAIRCAGIPWPETGLLAQVICELKDYMNPLLFRPADSRCSFPEEVDASWY